MKFAWSIFLASISDIATAAFGRVWRGRGRTDANARIRPPAQDEAQDRQEGKPRSERQEEVQDEDTLGLKEALPIHGDRSRQDVAIGQEA